MTNLLEGTTKDGKLWRILPTLEYKDDELDVKDRLDAVSTKFFAIKKSREFAFALTRSAAGFSPHQSSVILELDGYQAPKERKTRIQISNLPKAARRTYPWQIAQSKQSLD